MAETVIKAQYGENSVKSIITCLVLTFSMITGISAYAKPFYLAGDQDEAPFGYLNSQQQFVGIFVDIIAKAFKRADIELKHKPYPWKRAQMLVRKGDADGMITVTTPERLTYTVPCNFPLVTFEWVAFTRNNHPQLDRIMNAKKIQDLKGLTVLDYIGDGWGEHHLQGLEVDRSGSLSLVLKKLAKGRGDVFIQSKLITQYTLYQLQQQPGNEKLHLERIVSAPNVFYTIDFKLLIAKTSPYLSRIYQIEKTFQSMQKDGTLQAIFDNYRLPYK